MKHLYTYGLSLLLVTSLATATSITTTAPGYSSASEITLNIEGRLSGDKDWVGIYKKGSTSDWNNVLGWSWVQHRTSGLTIDTIIDNGGYSGRDILVDGGEFEARLFYHNSYSAEASTPFYMINEGRPHFMIVPKPFDVGDTIEVEVNTILSGDKDWVGIYPKNSDSSWTNVIAWNWVESNGIVAINKLRPGKTMSAGEYEARLFFHNSYTVEERDAFILRNAIETVKDTYRVNEQVTINISTTLSGDQDWVGIFPKNSDNSWGNVLGWNWVENGSNILDKNAASLPDGEYEIRLFFHNEYGANAEERASDGFNVLDGGNNNKVYPPETTLTRKIVDRIERPANKFDTYIDTAFEDTVTRTVTRLTNREDDKKGMNGHQYPKHGSAWNSDMSLFRLAGRIYDAETLREIPLTNDKTGGEVYSLMKAPESIRWSKHNPNVLYVMSGGTNASSNRFYELRINENRTQIEATVIYDLGTLNKGNFRIGHGEGNIDYEDKYVVLSATNGNDIYAVLLDIKEKRLVWGPKKVPLMKDNMDWISISPSGDYILVSSYDDNANGGTSQVELYNRNLENRKVLANIAGHGDIGKNENNEDIYVQWDQNGYSGYILKNQRKIILLDFKVGSAHVSCRNYNRKNWCYVSSTYKGFRETFALKLDGSKKVQRFAKSYAKGLDDGNNYIYSQYPTAIPSPDGTRVLFWSDHGNPENYSYDTHTPEGEHHYDSRDTYQVRISQ